MKNTYQFLKEIDKNALYSSDNDETIVMQLNRLSEELKKYLLIDFEKIIDEEMYISNLKIEYDNVDYRQSATGIIQILKKIKRYVFLLARQFLIALTQL